MKQVKGIWLPNREQHMIPFLESGPEFAGGPTYQFHKFAMAFPYIRNFRHALDVGAHCGLWSRVLKQCFKRVTAFEPVRENRECYLMNVRDTILHPYALGDRNDDFCNLQTNAIFSGGGFISESGDYLCTMRMMDSFDGLVNVDFIKIDVEGYELFVIQGGEQLIKRDKPCIIVEQKLGKATKYGIHDQDAVKLLKSWGAVQFFENHGDFCMGWTP